MTELVFIEGVSGVGKSTMVRALAEKLGGRAKSYVEFDYTNPIDFYCTAYLTGDEYKALCGEYPDAIAIPAGGARLVRYYDQDTPLFEEPLLSRLAEKEFCYNPTRLVSLEEYSAAYQAVWADFAAAIDETWDFLLFDGSLLHHPINDMMRNYHITGEQAVPHVRALLRALGRRKRHIFYLQTPEIGAQLTKAHRNRGQAVPTGEEIAFWEARSRNDKTVLERIGEPYHSFDISREHWDSVREQIEHILIRSDCSC